MAVINWKTIIMFIMVYSFCASIICSIAIKMILYDEYTCDIMDIEWSQCFYMNSDFGKFEYRMIVHTLPTTHVLSSLESSLTYTSTSILCKSYNNCGPCESVYTINSTFTCHRNIFTTKIGECCDTYDPQILVAISLLVSTALFPIAWFLLYGYCNE